MRVEILRLSRRNRVRTVVTAVIVVNDVLRLPNAHGVTHLIHDVERSANEQNIILSTQIKSATEVAFNRIRNAVGLCGHANASSPLSFHEHPFASLATRSASRSAWRFIERGWLLLMSIMRSGDVCSRITFKQSLTFLSAQNPQIISPQSLHLHLLESRGNRTSSAGWRTWREIPADCGRRPAPRAPALRDCSSA